MTLIERINNQVKLIERAERVKAEIPNININWETDLNKMDFSKLRTPISFGRHKSTLRLEKINPVEYRNSYADGHTGLLSYDFPNTLNLIELILSGERIIPPIFYDAYKLVDGEKMAIEGLAMLDGSHRLWVCSHLNLNEIPILRFDRVQEYYFTPAKWKYECQDENKILLSSIVDDREFVFDTNNISIDEHCWDYLCITEFL
jgi:hypothetical protein